LYSYNFFKIRILSDKITFIDKIISKKKIKKIFVIISFFES